MRSPSLLLVIFLSLAPFATSAQSLDWARSISGSSQELAGAVAYGADGSVITVGTFILTIDLDPGPGVFNVSSNGSADVFIQVLDSLGGFLWGGAIGAGGSDNANAVAVDSQGNILVTGRVSGTVDIDPTSGVDLVTTPNTAFGVYVIKLSASGQYLWGRIFGGNSNDLGNGLAVGTNDDIITVGLIGGVADLDPGPGVFTAGGNGQSDAFVHRMDANGQFLWGFAVGGTAADIAHGVAIDAQGAILVTGEFRNTMDLDPGPGVNTRTSGGDADIFVLKVSSSGSFIWGNSFGATGNERAKAIATGPDGGAVFTGRITSNTDFDPGPGTLHLAGDFTEPAFLCKLNPDGTLAWAFMLKSYINEGFDLDIDEQNNIVVCGNFGTFGTTALDLDPGPDTAPLLTNGGGDAFIASYTGGGGFQWGFKVGSAQNDNGRSVAWGTRGRVVLVGDYLQTLDVDPGPNVQLMSNAGSTDAFIIQYTKPECAGVFVRVKAILDGPHTPADFLPMSDQLRQGGLLPLQEPYTALGFTLEEPASTTTQALTWTLSSAIVDWVLVELRSAGDPSVVLRRRAALLQRDGDVVAPDGVAPVGFCIAPGDYHVALRHRNHLGVMTSSAVALTNVPVNIDFTAASTSVFGTDPRREVNGVWTLWPGNVVPNAVVSYTGASNDRDLILVTVGSTTPTNTVSGYAPTDVNLDGLTKYTGSGNDRDRVLLTVGGNTPNSTRAEQLP